MINGKYTVFFKSVHCSAKYSLKMFAFVLMSVTCLSSIWRGLFVTFWHDIKATFTCSRRQAKKRKDLSISQGQAKLKRKKKTEIKDTLKIVKTLYKNNIQSTLTKRFYHA